MGISSQMDPKTKQLVEEAETLVGSIRGPFMRHCIEDSDIDFLENAPAKMVELCSAVREQDERITELEQDAESCAESCAEYEAHALRHIGEEVIAGRQHEARGELPYWIGQIHEHYKRKLAEQDKRARHAEAERDAFDKRISELDAQNASLKNEIIKFTDRFVNGDAFAGMRTHEEAIELRSLAISTSPSPK